MARTKSANTKKRVRSRIMPAPKKRSPSEKSARPPTKRSRAHKPAAAPEKIVAALEPEQIDPPYTTTSSKQVQQLPAPAVTARRVALKTGHYAVRHLGLSPGITYSLGLPFGIVQVLSGEADISGAASSGIPALRNPNDTVMINVGKDGAEILITCFNQPGAQGAGFRFLLTPLVLPEVAVGGSVPARASVAGAGVVRAAEIPVSLSPILSQPPSAPAAKPAAATVPHLVAVGHSERLGDVSYGADEWIGGVGSVSLRLESFILHMRDAPLGLALEYGAVDIDGNVTWVREGVMAGTRGRAKPMYGVTARVLGAASGAWSISYECRFANGTGMEKARDGEVCLSRKPEAHLVAVKFALQPRAAAAHENVRIDKENFERVRILAHIEREGDRVFKFGEWVGTPGSGRAIEGLQALDPIGIEVASAYDSGMHRRWMSLSDFVGSRGRGTPITPLSFRMSHGASGGRLVSVSKFVGDPTLYPSDERGDVLPPRGARLEAFRLAVE